VFRYGTPDIALVSLAGMRVPIALVLFAVAALAFLPSCSSGSSKSGSTTGTTVDPASYTDKTATPTVTIAARDDLFAPQYTKVRAGTTVVFDNGGRNQHNVISADGSFHDIEAAAFAPGMTVRVVFAKPGTYDFYCSFHGSATAGMHGSLLVVP
jgi:plastocyanin